MDRGIDIRGERGSVDAFIDQWLDDRQWIEAHTSGSTGAPKTIRLAKADMLESARATCRYFGIGTESHLVMPLSVDYIAGKMMVVRALVSGATLTVVPPSRTLDGLRDVCGTGGIDLLPIVPAQLEALLASPAASRIRNVIIGGAPLSTAQIAAVRASGINAYATYGMTETCSHVALRHLGDSDSYEAMPGITFALDSADAPHTIDTVDGDGDAIRQKRALTRPHTIDTVDGDGDRPSKIFENSREFSKIFESVSQDDRVGALVIEAPRYTARRFVTNDMVRLIDERHFVWLGRRDNVINSGGIKIFPEHVEELLRPFLPDTEYYVSSRQSDLWGEELTLVIPESAQDPSAALAEAARHLPHHLLPKAVVRVAALAYTPNGKIKRQ